MMLPDTPPFRPIETNPRGVVRVRCGLPPTLPRPVSSLTGANIMHSTGRWPTASTSPGLLPPKQIPGFRWSSFFVVAFFTIIQDAQVAARSAGGRSGREQLRERSFRAGGSVYQHHTRLICEFEPNRNLRFLNFPKPGFTEIYKSG